jgi:hypothetical protein
MQRLLFLTYILLVIYPKLGHCQNEKRKALLIGNSKYVYYEPLSNSIRDVDSMAVALKTLGFEVTVKKNTEYRTLSSAVNIFVQSLEKDDIALLYYSGHGIGYNGNNYMLPIEEDFDCLNQLEDLIPISLNRIVRNIENRGVKNSFVFLDACRNLPKFKNCNNSKSAESTYGFVIPNNNPRGNFIFFATKEGSVANDDTYDKTNSLFTSELLKYIRIPDLSLREIANKVIVGVEQRSDYKQIPQKMEDLRGDFYFIKTSDEEKARIAAENKRKLEEEIREKLKKEQEDARQQEIKKANQIEQERIANAKKEIEKNKRETPIRTLSKVEINKTEYKNEIELGDKAYKHKAYAGALSWYESAKAFERTCNECSVPNNALEKTILDLQHNINVKKYKNWKTTNKILLGTSLVGVGVFSKYFLDFTKAKNDLNAKQKIADPDGDTFVYLSNTSSNNKAYIDYQAAYKKLGSVKEKSSLYNGVLIGGATVGTVYLVKKIIGKKKPTNLNIIPFNKGLSLSIRI